MMKKQSRQLTAFLLALLMFGTVSCGGGETSVDTADTTASDTGTTKSPYDENGFLRDNLPDDLDFGGRKVLIYVRGDTLSTEFDAGETGDIVDDAMYNRNLAVEERLNVDLEYFANTSADFWGDRDKYINTVRTSVMSNDGTIDIAAGLSLVMPTIASEGLVFNLLGDDIKYLDFDQPWWNEKLLSELSYQDRLYFVSGDVSLGFIKGVICMYYNKKIADDLKLDDFYTLVNDGKWTLDAFNQTASAAYRDLNGSSSADADDRFGFTGLNSNHLVNFFYCAGLSTTAKTEDGGIELTLSGERAADVIMKTADILKQDPFVVSGSSNGVGRTIPENALFLNSRALFAAGQFSSAEEFRELNFDYGIIPFPKYDEQQENYHTHARNTMTGFSIPITSDADTAAAVLEALASESYRKVTPAYYESAMKVKYVRDDETVQILDLIKDSTSYDFGLWHYLVLGNTPPSVMIKNTLQAADSSMWASQVAAYEATIEAAMQSYLNTITKLDR